MRFALALVVLLVVAGVAPSAFPQVGGKGRFQDTKEWARRLDDPAREEWQKPQEVLRALALPADAVVADIGAGTGYFTVRLARALPRGRVYGVDTEPEMVGYLQKRADAEGLRNLTAIRATPDSPSLPEPVDLALLVNVGGLMVSPGDYFLRLRTSLKPEGRVAIIATRPESPVGTRKEMRVPAEQVKRDMARHGYSVVAEHDFLPYQFFLVFKP